MDVLAIIVIIVISLIWIGLLWLLYRWGAGIAEKKGRSRTMGGCIAVLLGFIGLLVLYLMSDRSVPAHIQPIRQRRPPVS